MGQRAVEAAGGGRPVSRRSFALGSLAAVATADRLLTRRGARSPRASRDRSLAGALVPGQLVDLSRWKLTEPVARPGSATALEVVQPQLATWSDAYFAVDGATVRCTAPAQGATTSGASGATRCELREVTASGALAAWSLDDGLAHDLTVGLTCDATAMTVRREVIVGQVHSAGDTPPLYLSVDQDDPRRPLLLWVAGAHPVVLLTGVGPTTPVSYRLRAHGAGVDVHATLGPASALPPTPTLTVPASALDATTGLYFKAGCYNKEPISAGGTGSSTVHHSTLALA